MKYLSIIFTLFLLCAPTLAYAVFQPFQQLPGLENAGNLTTQQYIDALYVIAITAAAILAVFKLIWAGVQYMLSEVVTKKEDAKKDIRGALLGLLIILAAVTILNTINPNLTQINFLRNATPVNLIQGGNTSTRPSGQGETLTPIDTNSGCPVGQVPNCNTVNGKQECNGCYYEAN